jgi:hypothetical protein
MTYKEGVEERRKERQRANAQAERAHDESLQKLVNRRNELLQHLKQEAAGWDGIEIDLNEQTGTITLRAPPSPNYICINVDTHKYLVHTAMGQNPSQILKASKEVHTIKELDDYIEDFLDKETG